MSALDRFRLDGRVALVTGGSRGIGWAVAVALAEAGADPALAADLSDPAQARRLDILVNSAGIIRRAPARELEPAQVRRKGASCDA